MLNIYVRKNHNKVKYIKNVKINNFIENMLTENKNKFFKIYLSDTRISIFKNVNGFDIEYIFDIDFLKEREFISFKYRNN